SLPPPGKWSSRPMRARPAPGRLAPPNRWPHPDHSLPPVFLDSSAAPVTIQAVLCWASFSRSLGVNAPGVAKEFLSMAGKAGVRLFPGLLGLAVSLCLLSRQAQGIDEDAGTKVYKQALKSTVWIVVPSSEDTAKGLIRIDTGTGSVVNLAHGIVLTNYHVVGSSEKATVVFPIIDKGKLV